MSRHRRRSPRLKVNSPNFRHHLFTSSLNQVRHIQNKSKHTTKLLSKRTHWATFNGGFRARGGWGIAENAERSLCWSGRWSCAGFAWLVNTHTSGSISSQFGSRLYSHASYHLPNGRIIILSLAQDLTWTAAIFSLLSPFPESGRSLLEIYLVWTRAW